MQCFMRKPSEFSTCWTLHAIWGEKIHDTAQPTQALKMFEAGCFSIHQPGTRRCQLSLVPIGSGLPEPCHWLERTTAERADGQVRDASLCGIWWELLPHSTKAAPLRNWSPDTWGSPLLNWTQFRPCDLSQHTFFSYRISFSAMFVYWNAIPGSSHLYTK